MPSAKCANLAIIDRMRPGVSSVTLVPKSGPLPTPLFIFLRPQPLRSCFQLANYKVYNLYTRVLAFFKAFYKGQG
jgi:hypothetical protein